MDWGQVLAIIGAILIRESVTTIRNMWQARKDRKKAREAEREEVLRSRLLDTARKEWREELESFRSRSRSPF